MLSVVSHCRLDAKLQVNIAYGFFLQLLHSIQTFEVQNPSDLTILPIILLYGYKFQVNTVYGISANIADF